MKSHAKYVVVTLLLMSALMLGALIPGGPIETRDFSHIAPLTLGAFNVFLTALGLASFAVAYLVYTQRRTGGLAAAACGLGYFVVYVLDLAELFPTSPDAMPTALRAIEIAGAVLAVPLVTYALVLAPDRAASTAPADGGPPVFVWRVWALAAALAVGAAIVAYATRAAMGR